uniref:Protein TsetseEP domain-containing protein n=1 Tax=Anopheles culicifacies TaxID=139723 RepID=A0A182MX46_9DIPT
MLGTWVLSLGVICLLQCAVSGEPRPDFALEASVFGTVHVSSAVTETRSVVTGIDANLDITLNSTFPKLSELLQLTQEVGDTFSERLESVLRPLGSLAPSSSSEDVEYFNTVLSAIDSVQFFLSNRLEEINSEVQMLVGAALPSQFSDALIRVGRGLQELASALEALQSAVTAIRNGSSEESNECRPKSIRPKLVYRVVYAVRTVKAYLPAVVYTLTTTVENIALADQFVVKMYEKAEDVQEPSQYVNLLLATTSSVSTSVNNAVGTVVTRFNTVSGGVAALGNLNSLMAYSGVVQVLSSYQSTLQQFGDISQGFSATLMAIATHLEQALVPDEDTPTVNNSEVIAALVHTLIANGPYARYCFYKYAELVHGLAHEGLLGVEACVNREIMRLQQLRTALLAQVSLLLFDLEDIVNELSVCNAAANVNSREACVTMIAAYYNNVAFSFRTKFNNLYSTGAAEGVASKNRLLACVKVLQYQIVDGSGQSLKSQIENCAHNGPEMLPDQNPMLSVYDL